MMTMLPASDFSSHGIAALTNADRPTGAPSTVTAGMLICRPPVRPPWLVRQLVRSRNGASPLLGNLLTWDKRVHRALLSCRFVPRTVAKKPNGRAGAARREILAKDKRSYSMVSGVYAHAVPQFSDSPDWVDRGLVRVAVHPR
jgi:hypothetical protein